MKLTIEIDCDNDAFQAIDADFGNELNYILTYAKFDLIEAIEEYGAKYYEAILFDSNGNNVGRLTYE